MSENFKCSVINTSKVTSYQVVFFFSSRRRHTIWTGDWSSDVCSSDLARARRAPRRLRRRVVLGAGRDRGPALDARSEERRVGKECRLQWAAAARRKNSAVDRSEKFARGNTGAGDMRNRRMRDTTTDAR